MSEAETYGPRLYRNTEKMMAYSLPNWTAAEDAGLIALHATSSPDGSLVERKSGHQFINMSSYSYLGLNRHPAVIQGAIDALREEQIIELGIAPTRIQSSLMYDVQERFSTLFDAQCFLAISCSVATAALLPLVTSGALIDGKPRVTVFDKRAHFCMDLMKPVCADEAPVFISPHNDMNYLEDLCKKHPRVAYIADGAYSTGGMADMDALLELQDRYGLFLWLDDSHAMSVIGSKGEGFVRSHMDELNPLTIITGSLVKGFGCTGGIIMTGRQDIGRIVNTMAGPMCWSQTMSTANLGSVRACIGIHEGPELALLQGKLRENLAYFDHRVPTAQTGSQMPVRMLLVGDPALSVSLSNTLLDKGFYVAPVYFPTTARGKEGLRVMIRADVDRPDLERLCDLLDKHVVPHG
ncbi:aminotransferase class I/II-fold pyridoxal phosphate-dependent enzyme [Amycolatopsis alba]|uniref:8-amino-7-oxononanoate synthase n=1 Tax=Amycolatopsis alba DSM 44262 TaxID=1125972 RepID=A0A229RSR9_AMYAL|nr:aminotransferase class I/II-fold pyridoxal phosphate-dependent enzyme [Amycolatopsis alba]OXM49710.1 2-amino-3-ketobutyrate CoA ligase [Amycolatopsis alba DSM 44262]